MRSPACPSAKNWAVPIRVLFGKMRSGGAKEMFARGGVRERVICLRRLSAQCFSAFSFSALAAAMAFSARKAGTSS